MISRLSAFAAVFAVLATASIAFAATTQQAHRISAQAQTLPVVQLETVVVTGKRANLAEQ